ncbi:MAG: phosphoribosylformylglycinamidine synthase subunit PurL [Hyphomonadaceae bacterium]|nr:phosphoribosylformylglycinamidine synthase subunit PurL [Hyphomonadaceae bacterium]
MTLETRLAALALKFAGHPSMKPDLAPLLAPQDEASAKSHGLKPDEFQIILDRLGRKPNLVEMGIFSVMWSEHCSYKSTRRHLGKFPTKGPKVIQGPGENAGVVDIGDGPNGPMACIFKMESHNHPSYIEPYQGAATGVGGILRDVFTMGARPIALVNALRFGDPSHPKTRSLVAGVVGGIGGYGNCVGVPTVAGETQFHKGYNGNILVNAMAVGLADQDKIFYSRGAEPGNAIFYVGSKTGRDGIHGATMASAQFSEGDEEKRPTVQVGDPFTEKLLIEACLELMATDWIQSIQDMGAAGLTSSSVEIADKGGVGVEMDMDKVPQRETGMTAYEIMLSESQERMLMVLKPGREADAKKIFDKWDLDAEVIGYTTNTGRLVLKQQGQVVCDIPVPPLSQDAPNYDRPWNPPKPAPALDISKYPEPKDYGEVLLKLMSSPDMASKRWIWEQYDRHVMGDTIDSSQSGGDAAIVRIHGTNKALAICSDCNPHYVAADPYEGGKQAVAEAFRNLSAVGATPIAITDNLNFGNPEKPDTMGVIVKAIEGMAEACRVLDFPVVSGNVSLYNETDGVGIPPTPVVGGIGLIEDLDKIATLKGAQAGDTLILIGETKGHMGASAYARVILGLDGVAAGSAPPVNLEEEQMHAAFVGMLIAKGLVSAVHDLSDGGLVCALAEMALVSNVSMFIDRGNEPLNAAVLFAEDQGRYLVALKKLNDQFASCVDLFPGLSWSVIGGVGKGKLSSSFEEANITLTSMSPDHEGALPLCEVPLAALRAAHEGWLPKYMRGEA